MLVQVYLLVWLILLLYQFHNQLMSYSQRFVIEIRIKYRHCQIWEMFSKTVYDILLSTHYFIVNMQILYTTRIDCLCLFISIWKILLSFVLMFITFSFKQSSRIAISVRYTLLNCCLHLFLCSTSGWFPFGFPALH